MVEAIFKDNDFASLKLQLVGRYEKMSNSKDSKSSIPKKLIISLLILLVAITAGVLFYSTDAETESTLTEKVMTAEALDQIKEGTLIAQGQYDKSSISEMSKNAKNASVNIDGKIEKNRRTIVTKKIATAETQDQIKEGPLKAQDQYNKSSIAEVSKNTENKSVNTGIKREKNRKTIVRSKDDFVKKEQIAKTVPSDINKANGAKIESKSLRAQSAELNRERDEEVREQISMQDKIQLLLSQRSSHNSKPGLVEGRPFAIIINGDHQKITITEGDGVQDNAITLNHSHCEKTVMIPRCRPVHFQITGSCNIVYVRHNRIFQRMTMRDVGKYNTFTGLPPT